MCVVLCCQLDCICVDLCMSDDDTLRCVHQSSCVADTEQPSHSDEPSQPDTVQPDTEAHCQNCDKLHCQVSTEYNISLACH